ncbi:MAG: hypothetical protein ACOC34_07575 [Thermotogota bacterium]
MNSKLLGLDIFYDVHATNRSVEREIDLIDVKRIIDDPTTQCRVQKNGRLKFTNSGTVVIGQVRNAGLWIKTVYCSKGKERR